MNKKTYLPREFPKSLERMDIREAQPRLRELVLQAHAGIEVVLTDGTTPLARLVPVTSTEVVAFSESVPPTQSRMADLHAGAIWTSENKEQEDAEIMEEFAMWEAASDEDWLAFEEKFAEGT